MNSPRNRSSIQRNELGGNRGSMNLRSGTERGSLLMPEEEFSAYDFQAFFAAPPTRWEQSENIGEYLSFIWQDWVEWCGTLDFKVVQDGILYLLERFTIKITVDDIMMLFTIYTLFGSEIEILSNTEKNNQIYENMFTVCFVCFCIELLANTIARTTITSICPPKYNGYLFSFFFWLDVLAIVSLFPEMKWIANPIGLGDLMQKFNGSSSISQAARVVRLVRLIRLVKLYKIQYAKAKKAKEERELYELVSYGVISAEEVYNYQSLNEKRANSKLGSQLSDSITKKVMLLILIMIIILPLITYTAVDHSAEFAVDFLHQFHIDPSINNQTFAAVLDAITQFTDKGNIPDNYLLRLKINGETAYDTGTNHDFPKILKLNITDRTYDNSTGAYLTTSGLFTQYNYAITDATYSIVFTIIVAIILVSGAIIFTTDAEQLVLKPIERMMNMVEAVAENPLASISLSPELDGDAGGIGNKRSSIRTEYAPLQKMQSSRTNGTAGGEGNQKEGRYETRLLETTLEKITGLLRVGFGEAGAGIISANLSTNKNSIAINPLLPGVRIYAIFGFCDIHHFEDINLRLSNDVLTFINTIAEIVHSHVHAWGGQCNKNLGNAFVIVWRIGDEETLIEANSASILSRKKTGLRSTKSMESMRDSTDSPNKLYDSRKKWNSSQSFDSSSISSSMRKKGFTTNNTPFSPTSGSSVDSHSQVDEDENNTLGAESTVSKSKKNVNIDLRRVPGVDQIADGALIGYLKVIADINRSSAVLKYREDPRLNETDKPKKIPAIEDNGSTNSSPHRPLPPVPNQSSAVKSLFNDEQLPLPPSAPSPIKKQIEEQKKQFKVRMGFGLHAGWAIEGAVGSIYKVDATYLSPHVNMAARLETSSRQYKVPILMSHFFHELLSEIPQKKCRKLDVVTVKGSEVPIGIFTYDCFQEQFFTENSPSAAPLTARALHRLLSASGMNSHGSKKIIAQHRRSRTNSNGDSPSLLGGRPRTPDLIKRSSTPELGGTGSNNGSASKPLRSSTPDLRKVTFQAAGSSRITSTPSPSSQPPAPRVEGSPSLFKSKQLLLEDGTAQIELTQQSLPSPPNFTAPTHRTKSGSMDEVEGDSPSLLTTSSNNSKKLIHSQAMRDASMPKDGVNLSRSMIASTGSSNNLVKRNSKSDTTNGNDDLTNPPDRPADLPPARPFSSKDPSAPSSFYEPKKALTPPLAPESRLLLSEVHKELLIAPAVKPSKRSSTSSKQSTSSRTSATSNSLSKRSSQSTTGAGRLPLPPLSTQHSPTARLLLGQVHKELRKIQKEVDRRKSDFNSRRSTANHLRHGGDDDEEPIDYGAIDEYLKKLFPDAEGIVVPPLDENIMTMSEVFIKDIDLLQLKAHLNDRFYELFSMGVNEYLRGNWLQAKVFLMDANKLMEECVNHFMQTPLYRKEKMYKSKASQRGEEEKEASGDVDSVLQVVKYRRQSARLSIRVEGPVGRSNSIANNNNNTVVATPPASLPRRFSVTRGKATTVKEQEEVIDLEFGDGPSQTLLNYMKGFDFQAPADWKGFRPLTSK